MPFNLRGPFLAQFGIDQLHSEGAVLVQGKKIPLVASLNPSSVMEQTVANLYVMEKVTVPAFSETKFVVRASSVKVLATKLPLEVSTFLIVMTSIPS
jgi:hypothetical protein